MALTFLSIVADSEGESHFGTTTVGLTSTDFAPPAPPLDVSEILDGRCGFLRARPGWFGDWHPAPSRQYMCLLSGVLEVSVSDGETRTVSPGEVVLLEDTEGKGHATRVVSEEPAVMMFARISKD